MSRCDIPDNNKVKILYSRYRYRRMDDYRAPLYFMGELNISSLTLLRASSSEFRGLFNHKIVLLYQDRYNNCMHLANGTYSKVFKKDIKNLKRLPEDLVADYILEINQKLLAELESLYSVEEDC